jgi:hypothetical protein
MHGWDEGPGVRPVERFEPLQASLARDEHGAIAQQVEAERDGTWVAPLVSLTAPSGRRR